MCGFHSLPKLHAMTVKEFCKGSTGESVKPEQLENAAMVGTLQLMQEAWLQSWRQGN